MREIIVREADSIVNLVRRVDGELLGTEEVTRCDLVLRRPGVADVTLSSVDLDAFTLQAPFTFGGRQTTCVRVNLGGVPTPPPDGPCEAHVFLWDDVATDGAFWGVVDLEIQAANPSP